jgi:hypothetical protein
MFVEEHNISDQKWACAITILIFLFNIASQYGAYVSSGLTMMILSVLEFQYIYKFTYAQLRQIIDEHGSIFIIINKYYIFSKLLMITSTISFLYINLRDTADFTKNLFIVNMMIAQYIYMITCIIDPSSFNFVVSVLYKTFMFVIFMGLCVYYMQYLLMGFVVALFVANTFMFFPNKMRYIADICGNIICIGILIYSSIVLL